MYEKCLLHTKIIAEFMHIKLKIRIEETPSFRLRLKH